MALLVDVGGLGSAAAAVGRIGAVIDQAHAAAAPVTTMVVAAAGDEVSAGIAALFRSHGQVFHAAGEGATSVRQIAQTAVELFGKPDTKIVYGAGDRGWPGDVPRFSYDTAKLRALGWTPRHDSDTAIRLTAERILANGF